MGKFSVYAQTSKNRYVLFGFIFEWRVKPIEYMISATTRTTIAFIPPSKSREGVSSKLWGYDKISTPNKENK